MDEEQIKKALKNINKLDDAIWLYAYVISEDIGGDLRIEAHAKLCHYLQIQHTDFKPFDCFGFTKVPTQKQAEEIIRREIKALSKPKVKNGITIIRTPLGEGEVRCGCCQIKMKVKEVKEHFNSTSHLKNAVSISHKIILSDLHIVNELKRKEFGYGTMLANIADKAEIELLFRKSREASIV